MNQDKRNNLFDAIFLGGGAASFFAAIQMAESSNKKVSIGIIERGKELLQKVKISGGGRCNVTNVIADPKDLSKNYPRGEKALIGPFFQFNSSDTVRWFESKGVKLKVEEDVRIFPVSNDSASILNCLINQAKLHNIKIILRTNIQSIRPNEEIGWSLQSDSESFHCKQLFIGTGSNIRIWEILKGMGLSIVQPVPSLFTFNIKDPLLNDLPGISVPTADINVLGTKLSSSGPLLITHWGLSGPGILKISAWGARILAGKNYQFDIKINWAPASDCASFIHSQRQLHSKKSVQTTNLPALPSRLWKKMVQSQDIDEQKKWADLSKKEIQSLIDVVHHCVLKVAGKSTFKEEFVSAGGIALDEIDFKYFRSKKYSNLYLAGEVLDIDGITGGFNFQAAWTGGWIAGKSMAAQSDSDENC